MKLHARRHGNWQAAFFLRGEKKGQLTAQGPLEKQQFLCTVNSTNPASIGSPVLFLSSPFYLNASSAAFCLPFCLSAQPMEISLTPHNSDTTINTSAADENVNEKQTELLGDLNYFSPDARRAGLKPHPRV